MGGVGSKDLWKRWVLSLESKRVGVMDGESGDERSDGQAWVAADHQIHAAIVYIRHRHAIIACH